MQEMSRKRKLRTALTILSFLIPAFLFYITFVVYPIFDTFKISLTNWNGMSADKTFVGFANYQKLLTDKFFWNAFRNTVFWVVIQLVVITLPTLVLALMITKTKRGRNFFRAGFYLPSIVSFSVAAVIWIKIYDPVNGPINMLLRSLGMDMLAKNWLADKNTVIPCLAIASSWVQYGTYMVMYITGLQNIDPQYYEAAELDGANALQKFWMITIPLLRNSMNVVISLIVVNAFKGFSMVWVTTQGGPFYTSDLLATYIYREGFTSMKIGPGAAGGVILAVVVVGIMTAFNVYRDWRAER